MGIPGRIATFPQLRYMGSKYRLLSWIHSILESLEFDSALDAFSGSGCVSYLLKSMGRRVVANDFLAFTHSIAHATVENSREVLGPDQIDMLLRENDSRRHFIRDTFRGIFFTESDLDFLDNLWANLPSLHTDYHRSIALSASFRSCVKRQPRGVFTVAGDPEHYKDGRRDLRLSLKDHFVESVRVYNATVFDNGRENRALRGDVFSVPNEDLDLVYLDPPYVPRSDDNCYVKRYHFLEGLASYWTDVGTEIMTGSKVRKIPKRYTPFSYRRDAADAFDRLFSHFKRSTLVLSYSSNGYPDLEILKSLMGRHKADVEVFERNHRYHFGTHKNVGEKRAVVKEYLIVGRT